ncbi:MAG: hypothetical protein LRY71_15610 [Bacillaceae bacterium]|nr:hypothetical protein [Bacillaceae bacterium]
MELFLTIFILQLIEWYEDIDEIIDNNEDIDTLVFNFNRLHEHMQKADQLLYYSSAFINKEIYYYFYFKNLEFYGSWISVIHKLCSPIFRRWKLDEVEIAILEWVKQDLENIRQGLYSEETRQEDPKISIDKFNEITTAVIMKDYSDMENRYQYEQRRAEKNK